MKQNYFALSNCYKQLLNLFIFTFCLVPALFSQTYVNGNLGTSTTSNNGTAAPAGITWHELQNDAGNTSESNSTLGVSHVSFGTNNFTLADDFTVPAGETWNLTKLTIYSLDQVTTSTTSPYTDIRVRIYNGMPGGGGTIVYGDLTTNRFASTAYTNKRAIFNSLVPTPGPPTPDLPIFSIDANISTSLTAGTYWVEWQVVYTAACFSLTSQTVGVRTMPGYNAIRSNAGVFAPLIDGGSPATAPDVAIDLPFTITYNTGGCSGTPTPGNTISSVASVCPGTSFDLSTQNSTTGSGVVYQWQSSPDGITFTNITGAQSSVLTTTLTAATFYQVIVTCGANPPATSTPVQVTVTTSSVTTQPTDASSSCGGGASFSAAASGSSVTFQWQQRVTAAAPWTNVINGLDAGTGATFSGATTSTLNISTTGTIMNGYQYRASITGDCAVNIFSNPATLTVTALTISVEPSAVNVCAGNTTPVGIAITTVNPSGIIITETTPFFSGALNLAIPDNTNTGIINALPVSVPAGAVITAATVTLNITHSWAGDMVIALKAPNGNVLNLDYALTSTGGTGATTGFTNTVISSTGVNTLDSGTDPWTDTFAPDAPAAPGTVPTAPTTLSAVNANVFTFDDLYSTPSGNWTLGILDAGAADLGSLINWTLTLTYSYPEAQPYTGVWTPATGLFTDAALTVPYVAGAQADSVWLLPTADGSYTVTASTPGCTAAPVVIPVTVLSAPSITTQPVDVTVCEGANASFTASASGTSYQWQVSTDGGTTFTDVSGQTTTTLTLTAVTAAMNNNKYRLVVSSCGPTGLNSDIVTLTVNSSASITAQPADATVCVGNDATFSVTAGGSGTLTYLWEVSIDGGTTFNPVPGATSSTLTVPAVTAGMNNSIYHVIITSLCSTGLVSGAATLTVSSLAVINTQPSATSACAGSNATFSVVATGPGLTYQWQVSTDGGVTFTDIAGETNSTLTLSGLTDAMNNNQYQVVILSSCSATGANSDPAALTVFAQPAVTIVASPFTSLSSGLTTTITATSTPVSTTFSWLLNGGVIAGATGNTITVDYSGLGDYTAVVRDANGCTATSNQVTIADSVSTNVAVYPNPSTGVFQVTYIDSTNSASNLRMITVYDSKGSRIYQQSVQVVNPSDKMTIDLSRQQSGVYILELIDASGIRLQTTRLIKL